MTNNKAVDELVEHVANKIDILVNNAGLAVESSAMKGGLITQKTTSCAPRVTMFTIVSRGFDEF
jgi:NADP-dependent 3-hydroxy acid dehydrogenase YdfG